MIEEVCYRQRNQIERLMSRLKQFRRLATRYDKTASSYLGFVHFIGALIWLRYLSAQPSPAADDASSGAAPRGQWLAYDTHHVDLRWSS